MNGRPHQFPWSLALVAPIVLMCIKDVSAQLPSTAAFNKGMETRLDEERARIRRIAEPVLERSRKLKSSDPEADIPAQTISIQAADAAFQNAKLSREISEIAVKEYEEGNYVQDLAASEGAVRLAESDVKRTMDEIVEAAALLDKIKKISTGSMYDALAVVQFEARVKSALLAKRKGELELVQARTKLELLRNYEKPKRIRELRSEVEKARSIELSKEQTVQLEKTKLAGMTKIAEGTKPPAKYQPILSLLDEAVRLDAEIHDRLARLEPNDEAPRAEVRKEIEELGKSLEAKVNEAGRLYEDLKFSELASDINMAASRPASEARSRPAQGTRPFLAKFQNLTADDKAKMKTATQEERTRILKKAGFTDEELEQMKQMREGARRRP